MFWSNDTPKHSIHNSELQVAGTKEAELQNTIVMYDIFTSRSSMWDEKGKNPEGEALEEAVDDTVFNPLTATYAFDYENGTLVTPLT